jgi:hypothetical protein
MSRIIKSGCLRRECRAVGRDPKPEERDNHAPVEGELETELRDGRSFTLRPGMNYQVSDFGDDRSSTKTGAKLFIVD